MYQQSGVSIGIYLDYLPPAPPLHPPTPPQLCLMLDGSNKHTLDMRGANKTRIVSWEQVNIPSSEPSHQFCVQEIPKGGIDLRHERVLLYPLCFVVYENSASIMSQIGYHTSQGVVGHITYKGRKYKHVYNN